MGRNRLAGPVDTRYEKELRRIAGSLPARPCVIALAAATETRRSASMASDLASTVARRRPGHTVLLNLESPPAGLDQELGAGGELGLGDVIAGRAKLRDVATPSGTRGFIFVPAGASATPTDRVLGSAAWRRIGASALDRQATLLLFLELDKLQAGAPGTIDGVVLLGGSGTPTTSGIPVLGRLAPPRLVPRASRVLRGDAEPEPFRPVLDPGARVGRRRHGVPKSRVIGITVIVAVLFALVAIAVAVLATAGLEPTGSAGPGSLAGTAGSGCLA